jgi:hypothetical protein
LEQRVAPRSKAPRSSVQISKNKNKSLNKALHNRAWIRDTDLQHAGFTSQHFVEYVQLWHTLKHFRLQGRQHHLEFHGRWKIHNRIGLPRAIHWINDDQFQTTDLESLGATKMQVLWVARHPKQNLDLR